MASGSFGARLVRGGKHVLRYRFEWRFRDTLIFRALFLKINCNSIFRKFLRKLFTLTHPVHAVSIGDRNDSFFKYSWLTLDVVGPADYVLDLKTKKLPFPNGSVGYINASHVLEHFDDSELRFFLSECYRVLCSGGFFRVVVPDLDLFIQSFEKDGLSLHFDRPATLATAYSIRDSLRETYGEDTALLEPHNGLISIVASYTNGEPPIQVSRCEFEEHFNRNDLDGFVAWATSLKKTSVHADYGHCNGFDFSRLSNFLREAKFDLVNRGFFDDPFVPKRLRGIDLKNKQHISLYVNASKH